MLCSGVHYFCGTLLLKSYFPGGWIKTELARGHTGISFKPEMSIFLIHFHNDIL